MKSIIFIVAVMAFVSVAISAPLSASAQSMATMPVLYNQSGTAVNVNTTTPLPAGYYYLQPGAQTATRVYYYGNGTYYNETSGLFGGNITNPNGTAGVPLGYATVVGPIVSSPGVPNTGAGGMAATLWSIMIASAAVLVAGGAYFFNRRLILARS